MEPQTQIQVRLRTLRVRSPKPPRDGQVLAQPVFVEQVAHQPSRRPHMMRIVAQRRPVVLHHPFLVLIAGALDRARIVQVSVAITRRLVIVHQP